MTKTLTLEGDITTSDAAVGLTTQGSTTQPSVSLPSEAKKIDAIIAAVAPDLAAAGAAGFLLRLGGNAVLGGEQTIFIAGAGGQLPQATSDPDGLSMVAFILEDADIEVRGGDTIKVQAEMCGDDLGDAHVAVTLVTA